MNVMPICILMVEDNEGDVLLTTEALTEAKVVTDLHVVRDGVEAIEYLYRRGEYSAAPRPDLILLDLNLPRRDGRQVLAEIKGDTNLRHIPVVVLTSSSAEQDIVKAYDLHANCYIVKPVDFEKFADTIRELGMYWVFINKPPVV